MGNQEQFYSEMEVIEKRLLPGVTNRITLHRKRKEGLIGFIRVGHQVFYSQSHLDEFLARCERPARPKQQRGLAVASK